MLTLLTPFRSTALALKNRVVMAPMTRARADNPDRTATGLTALYYTQRATAGLIVTEGIPVSSGAVGAINVPGIYTQKQVDAWQKVTDSVHGEGGKIFAQLWHVGRLSHPDLLGGELPLAPSAVNPDYQVFSASGYTQTVTPRAMSLEDIEQTICDFVQAANNAILAGFDGVELHAANGYLFHQFFAKCSNQRKDKYGGSIENRARFLFDILDRINEKIPLSKVGIRISPSWHNLFGIERDDETTQLFKYVCDRLNSYSLAYLHIAGFAPEAGSNPIEQIITIAKHYRKLYNGTLVVNRGFTQDIANKVIGDDIADLVSFGELYISNPDLVDRFKRNSPLNQLDKESLFVSGESGYTDYPFLLEAHPNSKI
ncbi:alkene reductase [Chitinophaga sp. 22321]|nr:alkene reductase [Chitinophaga hostae]